MRETSQGLGNGNPVRALCDDGMPGKNIAQVGLASFANSTDMHRDALDGGHRVVTIGEVRKDGIERAIAEALGHVAHCEAIMVDCDIDVIDRGQFPGAPGARPGGMAAHDFFAAVRILAAAPTVRLPTRTMRPSAIPIAALGNRPSGLPGWATIVATWQSVIRRSHMLGLALGGAGASRQA